MVLQAVICALKCAPVFDGSPRNNSYRSQFPHVPLMLLGLFKLKYQSVHVFLGHPIWCGSIFEKFKQRLIKLLIEIIFKMNIKVATSSKTGPESLKIK